MAKQVHNASGSTVIQYVLPLGGTGWVVRSSNAARFTVITNSKREAISIARDMAKAKHHILEGHDKKGQLERRESYAA